MKANFENFRLFSDYPAASDLSYWLQHRGIEAQCGTTKPAFTTYANSILTGQHSVQIRRQDFDHAEELLRDYYGEMLDSLPPDYYLFSFTDAELKDLVKHEEKWGPLDYALARKLLANRNYKLPTAEMQRHQDELKQMLATDNPDAPKAVFWGYILAFLGVPGMLVGWQLAYGKRTLSSGEQVMAHNEQDRKSGRFIFALSIAITAFAMVWIAIRSYRSIL